MNPPYIKTSEVIKAIQAIKPSFFKGAQGATEEYIQFLTEKLGKPLPLAYVDFLRCIGVSSGNIILFVKDENVYDFLPATMQRVFEEIEGSVTSLFPIAFREGDVGSSLLCLNVENSEYYDDPELHIAGLVWGSNDELLQYNDSKPWDCNLDNYFSQYINRKVFVNSLIKDCAYNLLIRPDITDAYWEWASRHDVDTLVPNVLVSIGFQPFIAGYNLYERENKEFIAYKRYPGHKHFFLYIGTHNAAAYKKISDAITQTINFPFIVKSL